MWYSVFIFFEKQNTYIQTYTLDGALKTQMDSTTG